MTEELGSAAANHPCPPSHLVPDMFFECLSQLKAMIGLVLLEEGLAVPCGLVVSHIAADLAPHAAVCAHAISQPLDLRIRPIAKAYSQR